MRSRASADVKASFIIGLEHDAFLKKAKRVRRWSRSQTIREALDRLMRDRDFFSPPDLHNSAIEAHTNAGE